MADFDFQVTLNEREIESLGEAYVGFHPGDDVEGTFRFTPGKSYNNCRGLQLEAGFKEHGQGSGSEHRLVDERVYEGPLTAGRMVERSFRFKLPGDGPITYAGHNVNFTWFVRIRIDIPMWFDKREEHHFRVLAHCIPED